jgi:excisionase family DNA binding protein
MTDAPKRRTTRELSTVPLGILATSTFLTVPEAAVYLRFATVRAFEKWLERHPTPKARRGRTVLFYRKDLEAAVRPPYLAPPKKTDV